MHDRRVNDQTYIFGNQGGLFMGAMTWWDHETESVWSQVWGQAIDGPLKGTTLEMIPASIVPWETWRAKHPHTVALDIGGLNLYGRELSGGDWVAGIAIDTYQKAYYVEDVASEGVVNDDIGPYPVAIYVDKETLNVHAYLRQADNQVLTFVLDESGKYLIDMETGNRWSIAHGLPDTNNAFQTELLHVPYMSSFAWSWLDFYPNSEFYQEYRGPILQ